jgi:hypothetical protein
MPRRAQVPPGFAQQKIDEEVAGGGFVVVVVVRARGIGRFGGGDLGAQFRQLGLKGCAALVAGASQCFGDFACLNRLDEAVGGGVQLVQARGGDRLVQR